MSTPLQIPPEGQTVTLFQFEGTAIHIESDEAKQQIAELGYDGIVIFF